MNTVYDSKRAIPNKFLNPDGTYSTLQDIIGGGISGDLFIVVEELPETGEENKIYLVPKDGGGFYEYSYIDGEWNVLGDVDIDLSDYVTTEMLSNTVNTINSNIANTYNNSMNYTNNALKNYVPLRNFPNTFIVNQNTLVFFNSIIDTGVTVGSYYLGGVELTDMPTGLIQAEVQVAVYPNDVLYATMRSSDMAPYIWEANSYDYTGWENFSQAAVTESMNYTNNAINEAIGDALIGNY